MTSRSPLHPVHERLGARFTPFGDWEMPLQYEGTLAEHMAVRESVGLFDVSHLGRFSVRGEGAEDLVNSLLTNDLGKIRPGRTQYTLILNEAGGIIDDIIVWWLREGSLIVLPNGANHDRVVAAFTAAAPSGVTVEDLRPTTVLLAVQGPQAPETLTSVLGATPESRRVIEHGDTLIAGTGYTGEAGGEVIVPLAESSDLFEELLAAGATPCGLGARDTLRLEAGLPLWGQDIDESTNPFEAGLSWAVGWDVVFQGRDALAKLKEAELTRRRIGFVLDDRRPPRAGYPLRSGASTGTVTSGNFSPLLGRGIGLGYLSPPPSPDATEAEVEIRDQWVPATLTKPPFVDLS